MTDTIIKVQFIVDYLEVHLAEKINLTRIADEMHHSPYHLHHLFTVTTGISLHHYLQRRRLTEAARFLCHTKRTIAEIALSVGYESQQAFTAIFKKLYKQSPQHFRQNGAFYPLQLPCVLHKAPSKAQCWQIDTATSADYRDWLQFLPQVVSGFPGLQQAAYQIALQEAIRQKQAFLLHDDRQIIGAMLFCQEHGSIFFLAIHPQYNRAAAVQKFLQTASKQTNTAIIETTTFRQQDKADLGDRRLLLNMGFQPAELLQEFGYPTQKMKLQPLIERTRR